MQTRTIRINILPDMDGNRKEHRLASATATKSKSQNNDLGDPPAISSGGCGSLESSELFGSRNEIVIRHNGREYRLRRTRLGKLILTA